ncbi:MAG: 16S rRNA (guanine(966)-N(2))-methyltransferase RsmD [Actinomycetota bacterium]
MRVVAGLCKGRKLVAPTGRDIRPSSDRLKEGLFSRLGRLVEQAQVLDLYAGTGALGIEALSRGAAGATFVDKNPRAVESIQTNLRATRLDDKAEVVSASAAQFVSRRAETMFHVVLIDPPYEIGIPSTVLESLVAGGFVDRLTRIVVEVSSRLGPPDLPESLELEAERRYGDSVLLYTKMKDGH